MKNLNKNDMPDFSGKCISISLRDDSVSHDCVFHLIWTAIPVETGQLVHTNPDTQSSDSGHACRSEATLFFSPYFVLII